MSTLGQKPATQHVSFQKQTITGNSGTSYTLQQSVGSELDIAVFINNTRQEPTTAYTASGTSLVMTGAVNSSDHFYVIFLAKAINTAGLPVSAVNTASINANAVTEAKIASTAVTNAKIANSTIDLTSKVTGALPLANGGTGQTASAQTAQCFRLAANEAGDGAAQRLTNWEEVDNEYTRVGAANWSESAGVFSSATTGTYLCMYNLTISGGSDEFDARIRISTNSGSNFSTRALVFTYAHSNSGSISNQFIFSVPDVSTFRLDYYCGASNSIASSSTILGDSNYTATGITFVKLGVI